MFAIEEEIRTLEVFQSYRTMGVKPEVRTVPVFKEPRNYNI